MSDFDFNVELIALDTESRRLASNKPWELVSLGLYSSTRGPLVCHPVRPRYDSPDVWEEHLGLASGVLETARSYESTCEAIRAQTFMRDILVWNAPHEIEVLPFLAERAESGRPLHNLQDLMVRSAPLLRPWNRYFGSYQWPSLADAASELGLNFAVGGHHSAVSDAQMLIQVWKRLEAYPIHLNRRPDSQPTLLLVDEAENPVPF